jgi:hypothetical protein
VKLVVPRKQRVAAIFGAHEKLTPSAFQEFTQAVLVADFKISVRNIWLRRYDWSIFTDQGRKVCSGGAKVPYPGDWDDVQEGRWGTANSASQ